jgi:tRNA(Ile)-lysidine synthase
MNLAERFILNWQQKFPQLSPENCKLVLAVSGGIDSIVLVDLIAKAGFDFVIAHCNFQLRGAESVRDEAFVRSLENDYEKEVLVKKFDTAQFAEESKTGIQEAARKLRYDWFNEIVKSEKLNEKNILHHSPFAIHLLTAHHANDNIETLLFNFLRGTGIAGLTGIREFDKENNIVRPLLFAKRDEIVQYALQTNLSWVEDSSNASDKYSRNYIRHQLIPSVKEIFTDADDNLLKNIERFKSVETLYQQAVELHKKKLLLQKGAELHIPVFKLRQAVPLETIVWEIIKPFSFSPAQVTELVKLLDADNGSYIASATHRIIKNRNWLIITSLMQNDSKFILVENNDKEVLFEEGKLKLEKLTDNNIKIDTSKDVALIDLDAIKFPLLLRKWKQGDYFYPLGMKKKKKLSKFFIDLKLSLPQKEKVWVIESNKKIVWVVGLRIDNRIKITDATKHMLKISLERINH